MYLQTMMRWDWGLQVEDDHREYLKRYNESKSKKLFF